MAGKYSAYNFNSVHADALFLRGRYKEAFHEYHRGATLSHDPRAAFNLAYMYHRGIYLLRDFEKARRYYTFASHMDGGEAEFNLALMMMRGEGDVPDFRAAVAWMKKSAADGCIEAEMYLGNAYTLGYVFDPADIECLSMIPFHRIIKKKTANVFLPGDGFDQRIEDARWEVIEADENDAFTMFRAAASHSETDEFSEYIGEMSATAKFMLGRCIAEGYGSEYNPAEGFRQILKAAGKSGSREAAQYLIEKREEAAAYGIGVDDIIKRLTDK